MDKFEKEIICILFALVIGTALLASGINYPITLLVVVFLYAAGCKLVNN